MTTLTNQAGDALAVVGKGKVEWGIFNKMAGGPIHTGAIGKAFSGSGVQQIVPNTWYGTLFGTCHQATNATLLQSGVSSTVTDIYPHWSTFASTVAYGNYGGGLPRTSLAVIGAMQKAESQE